MGKKTRGKTLTLGEFFANTSSVRSSGLLGARQSGGVGGDDEDASGELTSVEVMIGNAAASSAASTSEGRTREEEYVVTCYVRGDGSTTFARLVRAVEFVFGGGLGTRRVEAAPFEFEMTCRTAVDVEVTLIFDRAAQLKPFRAMHAIELSASPREFSRSFTIDIKPRAMQRLMNKDKNSDGGAGTPGMSRADSISSIATVDDVNRGVDAWSVADVSEWLKSSNLDELVDKFAAAKVNGYELLRLTESDLRKSLQLESNLERVRVIRAINILRASAGAADAETDELPKVSPPLSKPIAAPRGGLSPLELELDVSWIEFVSENARASVLIGWFMHVLDEVKAAEYDEPGPQLSVYCEAALQAARSCEAGLEERLLDILESTPGWDPRRKLFPTTCDAAKLQEQLMQLYLEVKAFEEFHALDLDDERGESYDRPRSTPAKMPGDESPLVRLTPRTPYSASTLGASEAEDSPSAASDREFASPVLNATARSFSPTPLGDLTRSSVPEDEPIEGDRVMQLNLEWEIDYNDIEFEGGVPSSKNRIGHGGFGEVFLGRYHGSLVAVKKLFNQDMMGKGLHDFRREVQILSKLRHPSIVLWLGACTQVPNLTIVLEYMDKGSLHQLLHRTTSPYTMLTAIRWAMTIAQGMVYLHSARPFPIVHCDLNTNNVLVNRDGMVKITDFGLSKVKHSSRVSRQTGMTGTVNYAAPEVIKGGKFSEASDVFAFGVIVWELLTRRIPWEELNEYQIVFQMTEKSDSPLAATARTLILPDTAPSGFDAVVKSCWATQPEHRVKFKDLLVNLRDVHKIEVEKERALRAARSSSMSSLSGAL